MALTQVQPGMLGTPQPNNFKNRIINGGMVISQYNSTSSTTPANNGYPIDRFAYLASVGSKMTIQQNQNSVIPPAGFSNYLGLTSVAATTVGSGDYYFLCQKIEGYNVADLNWGTANAKTVTLSFWVRSSLTGTFGGAVVSEVDSTTSYPFSYTISTANTWEQKAITIVGPTIGSWSTTNGVGMSVRLSMGMGSTYSGTAGAWVSSFISSVTGATSVVGTNGATFYITGVQLEVGVSATGFDYRPYGTELQLCQRYYTTSFQAGGTPASPNSLAVAQTGLYTINGSAAQQFPVPMRTSPTVTCFAPLANPAINNVRQGNNGAIGAGTVAFVGERSYNQFGPTDGVAYQFGYTATAEL